MQNVTKLTCDQFTDLLEGNQIAETLDCNSLSVVSLVSPTGQKMIVIQSAASTEDCILIER